MLHICAGCGKHFTGQSGRVHCSRKCYAKARTLDRTGHRHGKLVVLEQAENGKSGKRWLCQCDCGKKTTIYGTALYSGQKSCGCEHGNTGRHGNHKGTSLSPGMAAKNAILRGYKYGAKNRGKTWSLTEDQFFALTQQDCHFCGIEPSGDVKRWKGNRYKGTYVYNGIDRLDNDIGYTPENCVPCCKWCNKAKNVRSSKEFLEHVTRVYQHQHEREGLAQ